MDVLDTRLIDAWQAASEDLGFRFISPYRTVDRVGNELCLEGYLPDFGGAEGIAIVSFSRRIKLSSLDVPMSILPKEARKYVRKHVIEELRDWGWFGVSTPPVWLGGN